jgi:hypothetical protein
MSADSSSMNKLLRVLQAYGFSGTNGGRHASVGSDIFMWTSMISVPLDRDYNISERFIKFIVPEFLLLARKKRN